MAAAVAPALPFAGFPKQGVPFFRALALAQSRDWFQAHKQDYETLWRAPMAALLEELRAPPSRSICTSASRRPRRAACMSSMRSG